MNLNRPKSLFDAPVAQWIEQWIPNPCVASSILAGGTRKIPPYVYISSVSTILQLAEIIGVERGSSPLIVIDYCCNS